jgi:hypothetical protein
MRSTAGFNGHRASGPGTFSYLQTTTDMANGVTKSMQLIYPINNSGLTPVYPVYKLAVAYSCQGAGARASG